MEDVWRLRRLKGERISLEKACNMVAQRLFRTKGWNETRYDITPRKGAESFADTLRKMYYKDGWHSLFSEVLESGITYDPVDKDRFLAQFNDPPPSE